MEPENPKPIVVQQQTAYHAPLISAGTSLGIGMGGFSDRILFDRILELRAMLSAKFPKTTISNIEINMFWDGMFYTLTWTMTAIGLALFWKAARREDVPWLGKVFVGGLFLGWGLFNLIEGIIDHYILNLHHVYEAQGQSKFDYLFLLSGLLFIVGGLMAIRSQRDVSVAETQLR